MFVLIFPFSQLSLALKYIFFCFLNVRRTSHFPPDFPHISLSRIFLLQIAYCMIPPGGCLTRHLRFPSSIDCFKFQFFFPQCGKSGNRLTTVISLGPYTQISISKPYTYWVTLEIFLMQFSEYMKQGAPPIALVTNDIQNIFLFIFAKIECAQYTSPIFDNTKWNNFDQTTYLGLFAF